jgi:hypothetical protein
MLEVSASPQVKYIESEKGTPVVFQLDRASPHFSRNVRHVLSSWFPNRWTGISGPITWPPRGRDLTSLDFFIWGYVGNMVYADKP